MMVGRRGSASSAWLGVLARRVVVGCALAPVSSALGAGPIGQNGDKIGTSDYAIDLNFGSVLAGNRVTGLGGAYVAIAEDVDGDLQNPAAPAVRPFYSVDRFDYWLGLGLTFPASYGTSDFFNSGERTDLRGTSDSVIITPALNLQWGTLGLGLAAEIQEYELPTAGTPEAGDQVLAISLVTTHYQVADTFFDGQLVVGVGIRRLSFDLSLGPAGGGGEPKSIFESAANGIEVGAVWRPHQRPFRFGLALRSEIETRPRYSKALLPDAMGDIVIEAAGGPLYLPERVTLPWDLNVGVAVQLGERPFNAKWRPPEELAERVLLETRMRRLDREEAAERRLRDAASDAEREAIRAELERAADADEERLEKAAKQAKRRLLNDYAKMNRAYVLLAGSLIVTGPTRNALGIESFLRQEVNRSGERAVLSPHVGIESEFWPNVLQLRAGSYLQPSRFQTAHARWHATLGGNVRLFEWSVFGLWPDDFVWSLGANLDAASRYFTWGFAISGWYPRGAHE
jgi:hypothetical protein